MDLTMVVFRTNTAITGIDPVSGKWDEQKHKQTITPLRALIMQIDGVNGCTIGRYEIDIRFVGGVTSKTKIFRALKAAVAEVAKQNGFFPLRGTKTPRVTLKPSDSYPTWSAVRVDFSTDLLVNMDDDATAPVHALLANADGARRTGVSQRALSVRFDRREVTAEAMMAHLKTVVGALIEKKDGEEGTYTYFPFSHEPVCKYRVLTTNIVI